MLLRRATPARGYATRRSPSASSGKGTGGPPPSVRPPSSVAVIGAGTAGVATSYLLNCPVTLFEAENRIGGNCLSQTVQVPGRDPIVVDLGAQFFHPDTHPLYNALMRQVGVFNGKKDRSSNLLPAEGSVCIFRDHDHKVLFSSKRPFHEFPMGFHFAAFSVHARRLVEKNRSWRDTIEQWTDKKLKRDFSEEIIRPWLTALIGSSRQDAMQTSARSLIQDIALAFPKLILGSPKTYNSALGFQGNLVEVLRQCGSRVKVQLGAPVEGVTQSENSTWTVHTKHGAHGPFDNVVLALPPYESAKFLGRLPWAAELVTQLKRYKYFPATIVVHRDPIYMPSSDPDDWCTYNAAISRNGECEGSSWLGPFHGSRTLRLFKSWATRREDPAHPHQRLEPREPIAQRHWRHPLITLDALDAAMKLRTLQDRGRTNGLLFAGQYTTGIDLQESAVYSAMRVASRLTPESPAYKQLKKRTAKVPESNYVPDH